MWKEGYILALAAEWNKAVVVRTTESRMLTSWQGGLEWCQNAMRKITTNIGFVTNALFACGTEQTRAGPDVHSYLNVALFAFPLQSRYSSARSLGLAI